MPLEQVDFLIVGQGLAGSLLAHRLVTEGQSVCVIDNHHRASASVVAAGIINPITGHRLNMTERYDTFMPVAHRWYTELSATYQHAICHPIPQSRLIKNQGQHDYLNKRLSDPNYGRILSRSVDCPFTQAQHGCVDVDATYVVDTQTLLQLVQGALLSHNRLRLEDFDYTALSTHLGGVEYQSISAKQIIFCEGYQAIDNPWLRHLPFKLSKGEILTVEVEQPPARMLSWGNWLVPDLIHPQLAKLGSNYLWNDLTLAPDPANATKFVSGLTQHTGITANIVKHQVGIRPTTRQRQPFVGRLSNLEHAYCFNGFGSKGCLLVPYHADLLCQHLLHGTALPTELNQWL